MTISIKYFASLAEELEKTQESISIEKSITISDLWKRLNPTFPMKNNTICALNLEYASPDSIVKNGDEVAFFPPVTGG